ncbi:MAG: FAD-dependent monooxygenase [Alphaproteobacteria bacterium]|nr:FAD-dependent monooxygenase [Alphaproteobacteria bacterium]
MLNQQKSILIVGGGISGLVLAIALRRKRIDVTVVEISPEWTPKGSGIHLYSNALRALDSIGLAQEIVAAGSAHDFYDYSDPRDEHRVRVRYPRLAGEELPALATITRQALHTILVTSAQQAGARIRLATTVADMTEGSGSEDGDVLITLSNGQTERHDLIVAADGIYSPMREKYLSRSNLIYSGQAIMRAVLPRHPDSVDPKIMFAGAGQMFGIVPVSGDSVYLIAGFAESEHKRYDRDLLHTLLQDRFRPVFGGLAPWYHDRITDAGQVTYTSIELVDQPPPWHHGRMIFMGDAVHASPPYLAQGAAMAIEDAIVLAELIGSDLPFDRIVEDYMARRVPRAEFIKKTSLERNRLRYQGGTYESADGTISPRMQHLRNTAQPLIDELYMTLAEPI